MREFFHRVRPAGVASVYLYGSAARGRMHAESDSWHLASFSKRHKRRGYFFERTRENAKGMNRHEEYCPFYDELTPLQQAIMEPPYNPGRPNIAALLAEQEAV